MATYRPGKGTVLLMSTANGSTALSAAAQVVSITLPQLSNPEVDVTHLGSTCREFMNTIGDGGTVTYNIEWDPADTDQKRFHTLIVSGSTPEEYKVVFPTTTQTWLYKAVNTGFSPSEVRVDDVLRATVTQKISGSWSITT